MRKLILMELKKKAIILEFLMLLKIRCAIEVYKKKLKSMQNIHKQTKNYSR